MPLGGDDFVGEPKSLRYTASPRETHPPRGTKVTKPAKTIEFYRALCYTERV